MQGLMFENRPEDGGGAVRFVENVRKLFRRTELVSQ